MLAEVMLSSLPSLTMMITARVPESLDDISALLRIKSTTS